MQKIKSLSVSQSLCCLRHSVTGLCIGLSVNQKLNFLYAIGTQKNCFYETLLLGTQKKCFVSMKQMLKLSQRMFCVSLGKPHSQWKIAFFSPLGIYTLAKYHQTSRHPVVQLSSPKLTHISLASYLWDISKQWRPRSDA